MYRIDEHTAVWNARRIAREQDAAIRRLVRQRRNERFARQASSDDTRTEAVMKSATTTTLRTWAPSKAEVDAIVLEMRPIIDRCAPATKSVVAATRSN